MEPLAKFVILFLISASLARDFGSLNSHHHYTGIHGVLKYLNDFGYLDDFDVKANQMSLTDIKDSIRDIQEMLGLDPDGVLDKETLHIMNTPRCSNKEKIHHHHHQPQFQKLFKRPQIEPPENFSLSGQRWNKKVLTYSISQYSYQRVSREFVDTQIRAAFDSWERHIDLRFSHSRETEVDIDIQFTRGDHGDNYPFPTDGSQLAHAFYPSGGAGLAGDIHFNDATDWNQKNILYYTALHEIGHTLGLQHSSDRESIMFSHFIQDVEKGVSLSRDDIYGIQMIYGSRRAERTSTTTETVPVEPSTSPRRPVSTPAPHISLRSHSICWDGRFDAMASISNGDLLVFRGEEIITLTKTNSTLRVKKSPEEIRKVFNGRLPSSVDAAFTLRKKTFIFKGNLYWRTTGTRVDRGYPKVIGRNFRGVPDNLDAAIVTSSNQINFIKGSKYWEYNLSERVASKHELRRHWRGIPGDGVDAAYAFPNGPNGNAFFFRNGRYWKSAYSIHPSTQPQHNPRDARVWWFSCTEFRPLVSAL